MGGLAIVHVPYTKFFLFGQLFTRGEGGGAVKNSKKVFTGFMNGPLLRTELEPKLNKS